MASSSSSSHSTPASSSPLCKYDVFLSFRGEDTRKTFVDHLYSALLQKAIHTYKDDKTLLQGESIAPSLLMAIKESQIAVIVFSKNYANSSWCLEELSYIMKCKNEIGLIVLPIFYDVEPTDVRKQKREFGEAFSRHEEENNAKVETWRKALVDASNIAGWEAKNIANGHESEFIKELVEKIFRRLLPSYSDVDESFVGMAARLQDLKSQLAIGSDCVRMIGIWGVGGIGKTTLATSVYAEISHLFEGCCILENIREKSSKHNLEELQENILSAVFRTEVKVHSIAEGKNKLKSMLCRRKVLLVLDDVEKLEQLEALAGLHNWFGSGSRIIITTRDEHILKTHNVDNICSVRLLSDEEAIQLFNKHAFNEKYPIEDYETLSLSVVSYAGGLPLALKVLGSFLHDKDEKQWMSALNRLKDIPEKGIVEKLKISYDGLKNEEKELFLDIACFFTGKWTTTDDAMEILDACGFHPEIGIEVLRQKALLTIDADGQLHMHDLVQEMGHYIVRCEHPNNPEHHSRVWKHEEIDNLCFQDATTENFKLEAIPYGYRGRSSHICKLISKMKRLRWLKVVVQDDENDGGTNFLTSYFYDWLRVILKDDKQDVGPNFLSNELRYIDWENYNGSSFPDTFQPMKLVVLKLHSSLQKELWKSNKLLPHLKVMELYRMMNLVSTPDFNGLLCLQELILSFCYKLEEIHPSLGNHRSIEYVSVHHCPKLEIFPTILHMEKLKTLEILRCNKIRQFPDIQANMESLVGLSLNLTGIEVVPSSIGEHCTNLTSLYLGGSFDSCSIESNIDSLKQLKEFTYKGKKQLEKISLQLSLMVFHLFPCSLENLNLHGCLFEDGEFPADVGNLSNLVELDLSCNDLSRLAFSLLQLTRLKLLNLSHCKRLEELPELPSNVAILLADKCDRLKALGNVYRNCKGLCGVSLMKGNIVNDGGRLLQLMLQGMAIRNGTMVLQLEGLEIPRRFKPRLHGGNTFSLRLPENWSNDFCGFLLCAVFPSNIHWIYTVEISIKQVTRGTDAQHHDTDVVWEESNGDTLTWLGYVSFASLRHIAWWDQTYNKLSFHVNFPWYGDKAACRGFGVRLVARESGSHPTETSSSSESSHYAPNFQILNDSAHALQLSLELNY